MAVLLNSKILISTDVIVSSLSKRSGSREAHVDICSVYDAIEAGAYPKWKFGVQVIPEEREHEFDFDLLDSTKLVPEDLIPVQYIGTLELNRNTDNYFAETEQVNQDLYF
jgi:catalase